MPAQFDGVQFILYRSGMESAPSPACEWHFDAGFGLPGDFPKNGRLYVVAVRPSDVAASAPEPRTLALALLASGATMVVRRKRPG